MLDLLSRYASLDVADKHARLANSFQQFSGPLSDAVREHAPAALRVAEALRRRDASAWSSDPAAQKTIANRLGWLDSPSMMLASIGRLRTFAADIRRDGFTDVVLLGMGGSSLAPEVLRAIAGVAADGPRFRMLDSTDPAAIRSIDSRVERTLYLLASKSGGTIEPNSLAAHFRDLLLEARVPRWADHFVAITDEGTVLADRARSDHFRDIFINPSNIGGRYSALSYFGLVPAALMGQDIAGMIAWGLAALAAADPAAKSVSGVDLGLAIGAAARAGRNKLTLLCPPALEPFGLWVEQLIAESTGKNGTGVVPVVGEPLGNLEHYGADRLFVSLRMAAGPESSDAAALKSAGQPVLEIALAEAAALGAEFVRWEIATAVAGAILGVNPFDEPNVTQAKTATGELLDRYKSIGRLPTAQPDEITPEGGLITVSRAGDAQPPIAAPRDFLTLLQPGDYFAILAFLGPSKALFDALHEFRLTVRDGAGVATTFGYGPRYLHSTGQLHKGGPDSGVFLMVTASPEQDLSIPGEAYSFAGLELAQALGDFASLQSVGRRVLHLHLPRPDAGLLRRMLSDLVPQ